MARLFSADEHTPQHPHTAAAPSRACTANVAIAVAVSAAAAVVAAAAAARGGGGGSSGAAATHAAQVAQAAQSATAFACSQSVWHGR
jgi:hypothetical protein